MHSYRTCGLEVRSDTALPGLPASLESTEANVTFVDDGREKVPATLPDGEPVADAVIDGKRMYSASRRGEIYSLRFHGLCDVTYDTRTGRAGYRVDPDAAPELAAVVLAGSTLAFILLITGQCVLHASAVEVDGSALAFVGHSGMGKSTLTVAACAAGATLVAEDVLVVEPDAPARCLAGNAQVRLRDGAISLLERADGWNQQVTADGRHAIEPPRTSRERVPLSLLAIPRPDRSATRIEVEQLAPTEAMLHLMNLPRLMGLDHAPVVRRQFEALGALARTVPVIIAHIPWGPPFAPDLGGRLLDLKPR